jgi:Na+/H+ antiporter NhaD/arsenite permease-like protein
MDLAGRRPPPVLPARRRRPGAASAAGAALCFAGAVLAPAARAAGAEAGVPDGADMPVWLALPFAGLLLSIAILPLATPSLWHHHFGKITAAWSAAVIAPALAMYGLTPTFNVLLHTLLLEYIPFIILLLALFTVAGGVLLRGNLHGTPATNSALLAVGTGIASITGTTGASMLLIRPLLRANDQRRYNRHVVIFFIFLVANIGGSLTPLGDPPLFLGFLLGVDFFWPLIHLFAPMLLCTVVLLAGFYALDRYYYAKEEGLPPRPDPTPDSRLRIEGWPNIALLVATMLTVLASGAWKPNVAFHLGHVELELQDVARDVVLLLIAALSWFITPKATRDANGFTWGPILEVAKLFAGIFITIIPAIAMLRAGPKGPLAPLVALVTDAQGRPVDAAYFWLTGGLSSFLDNAPTYLVFFNTAGGDPAQLMGPMATTLTAISAGAVFMGANTYIGNAPNFMVKAIAESTGVRMPSFFGYMGWSCAILLPLFALVTLVFFR